MPCPSEAELLDHAVSSTDLPAPNDSVGGHVAGCAGCQAVVAELREAAAALRRVPWTPPSGPCLDDDAIAALAAGPGASPSVAEREHLATCAECRARVATLTSLLRSDRVAAELRRLDPPRRAAVRGTRWVRVAGGLAAAAAIVLVLRNAGGPARDTLTLRETPVTLIPAPVPVKPAGSVTRVDLLTWHLVPRATQYRVTLYTQDGSTVWDQTTPDTLIALPSAVRLVPGAVYYWKVEARTDWNRWSASDLVELRIGGAP